MLRAINNIRRKLYLGRLIESDPVFLYAEKLSKLEEKKTILRTDVLNYLLSQQKKTAPIYLEIGVRNPDENFNKIKCAIKYSVDPGIEYKPNPVDFKMTSDEFFLKLKEGKILNPDIKFNIVFIDGMHTAEQVEKDVENALTFLAEDGYLVLHDCNPPTEYHAREDHYFNLSPARNNWNGSVWKAFYKLRLNPNISCCCIDSDWGVGVISKKKYFDHLKENFNPFFEYRIFNNRRKDSLNLIDFEEFKKIIQG
ncbi:MAG: class I SAM-dependent methyltransferase [Bacteroidia bacterium]|nr:class I SAM-dependent methyltransferase [Bacteroidia bacterium]